MIERGGEKGKEIVLNQGGARREEQGRRENGKRLRNKMREEKRYYREWKGKEIITSQIVELLT